MKKLRSSVSCVSTAILLGLGVAAFGPAGTAAAATYTLTKLLDNKTAVPDRSGQTFSGFISTVGFDGNTIVFFSGDGSTTNGALWSLQATGTATPLRLADATTTAPGNTGPFSPQYEGNAFGLVVEDVRNGYVVFNAYSPQGFGYYSIPEGGGAVSTLFNAYTSQPNLHGNSYATYGGARIVGDQVFFSVDLALAPQQAGIYSTPLKSGPYKLFGGTTTPIAGDSQGTLYPGAEGGGSLPAFNATTVAFEPRLTYRDISRYTAIYTAPIGGLTVDSATGLVNNAAGVVSGTTLVPGDAQGRTFDGQDLRVLELEDSGAVVFYGQASDSDSNSGGIYLSYNGVVSPLVTAANSLPGDTGHFYELEFGTRTARNGLVAFSSYYKRADGTNVQGIYTVRVADGVISKVAEQGDAPLGGASLNNAFFGLNSSGQVAFEGSYLANPNDTYYSYALFLGVPNGGGGGTTTRALILSNPRGGDNGPVTETITAAPGSAALLAGASFKLSAAGKPDIAGVDAVLNATGTAYTVTFNLMGKAAAVYDLVLTNADGSTTTKTAAFTVEPATNSILYGTILGRTTLRGGVPGSYTFLVGNRGDVDAYMVPVFLTFPDYFQAQLTTPLVKFPAAASADPTFDYSKIGTTYPNGDHQVMGLIIPHVPAGAARAITVNFTASDAIRYAHVPFTLRMSVGEPQLDAETGFAAGTAKARARGEHIALIADPDYDIIKNCLYSFASTALDCTSIFSPVPAGGIAKCSNSLLFTTTLGIVANELGDNATPEAIAISAYQEEAGFFIGLTTCAVGITPGVSQVLSTVQCGIDLFLLYQNCLKPAADFFGMTVVSHDPNDLVGSIGDGTPAHNLSGSQPLQYAVYFENDAAASAAAQTVTVTNPLDANLDLATFSLGPISFNTTVLNPPAGLTAYTSTVDLRPAVNLLVKVTANMNAARRTLTYSFQSLDPATGRPTTDPALGFLPPNKKPPAGDGFAVFYAKPVAGLATGKVVKDTASIVFDANSAITTPTWTNTIDSDAPSSKIAALPAIKTKARLRLKVSATDVGSGVASYNIFVSEDGGAFNLALQNAAGPKIVYNGVAGHKYKFFSQAVDAAGNIEPLKTKQEAKTKIVGADLIGAWNEDVTEKNRSNGSVRLKGKFTVFNQARTDATPNGSVVRFYLCATSTFDGSEQVIGRDAAFGVLAAGSSEDVKLTGVKLANAAAATGKFVIAVIDPDKQLAEADRNNNLFAFGPLP